MQPPATIPVSHPEVPPTLPIHKTPASIGGEGDLSAKDLEKELEKEREKALKRELDREKERGREQEREREKEEREKAKEQERAKEKEKEKEREKRKAREREEREKGLAIKLAPMPTATRPSRSKRAEPTPQKPDIRLPRDAIRAGKAGTKPLSEHIRKHEEKRLAAEAAKTAKTSPRKGLPLDKIPLAPGDDLLAGGRERPRRGSRPVVIDKEAEEGAVTLGGREQRQLKRKKAASVRRRKPEDEEEGSTPAVRKRTHIRRTGANTAAPRRENVVVELPCSVRSFSESIGVSARDILAKLLELGTMSTIAATLDADMAELLAAELGVAVNFQRPVALEQKLMQSLEMNDDPEKLVPRPPIVTFLGHVDHGKTSLLDRILGLDVAAHEKGGITQHIRAYRVEKDGRAVAFVDTPGHEAFTAMRARGANVTDIAVLVVAADDGIMPQTEEAISHARAAEVPIVVALNKIDLPGANPQRCYEQLAANELLPSEWGGETEVVKTSATTGEGIDKLLETLLTVAELHEYKADPDRPGSGACLESELHEGRGVVAKLLVRKGTLRVGDVIVCGSAFGRVKAMYDTLNPRKKYSEAGPSMPVNVTGLNCAPAPATAFTCSTTSPKPGNSPNSEPTPPTGASWATSNRTSPSKACSSASAKRAKCKRSTSSFAPTCAVRSRPSARNSRNFSTPRCKSKFSRRPSAASPKPTFTWPTPPTPSSSASR